MFAALQPVFADALLDPDKPVPAGVTAHTGERPARRFAIYRNNIVFSLVEALRERFPAVEKIVGREFFSFAARSFVRQHPPRSPLMMQFGENFPDFLNAFEPAAELPYLADVARLESFRVRAYHAADADTLGAEALQAIDPELLQRARLGIHPSVHLLLSRFPAVTIWSMNSGESELGTVDFDLPEDALVMREGMKVTVRKLMPGGAQFISSLQQLHTFPDAVESALAESGDFDLAGNLATLIAAGAITHILPQPAGKDVTP